MSDETVITMPMRERYAALLAEEQSAALTVAEAEARLRESSEQGAGERESDLAALGVVDARLALVRRGLSVFPEGITPPPPRLSDGEQDRIRHMRHNVEARAAQIGYILQHEIPGLELKLTVPPTPREINAWPGSADPFAAHYKLIRQKIAAKHLDIEQMREENERDRAEIERIEARVSSQN